MSYSNAQRQVSFGIQGLTTMITSPGSGQSNSAPLSDDDFSRALAHSASRVNLQGGQLGYILFALDNLRELFERVGRHSGEALIDHLGAHLARRVRSHDLLGRLGEGEFALLTPGMDLSEVTGCAVKLRHLISDFRFNRTGDICASFGVTHFQRGESLDLLENRARRALEHARAAGGNRVAALRAQA